MKTIKELKTLRNKVFDTEFVDCYLQALKDVLGLIDKWCDDLGIDRDFAKELKKRIIG